MEASRRAIEVSMGGRAGRDWDVQWIARTLSEG